MRVEKACATGPEEVGETYYDHGGKEEAEEKYYEKGGKEEVGEKYYEKGGNEEAQGQNPQKGGHDKVLTEPRCVHSRSRNSTVRRVFADGKKYYEQGGKKCCEKGGSRSRSPVVNAVFAQYVQRATDAYPNHRFAVCDLGSRASNSRNACLWLSIAAGWSRCRPVQYANVTLQGLQDRVRLLQCRTTTQWQEARQDCRDEIGCIAQALRTLVCGPSGFMRLPQQRLRFLPFFAETQANFFQRCEAASLEAYDEWLNRVTDREPADELVLVAIGELLQVTVIAVPCTPLNSKPWGIAQANVEDWDRVICVGNDNRHYVWLCIGEV